MYAQTTYIRMANGGIAELRAALETQYLVELARCEGFIAAQLLEQTDDPDYALLLVYWRDQASAEAFARTGSLNATVHGLASQFSGATFSRTSYIVSLSIVGTRPSLLRRDIREVPTM
jgi:heme-degrading monooxygenase HmoA